MTVFSVISLTMEAVSTCKMSVNFCEATRRDSPEESHFRTRRLENLKYNLI
jgi:hypothetical protein